MQSGLVLSIFLLIKEGLGRSRKKGKNVVIESSQGKKISDSCFNLSVSFSPYNINTNCQYSFLLTLKKINMSHKSKFPKLDSFKQIAMQDLKQIAGGIAPVIMRTFEQSVCGCWDYVGLDLVNIPDA
jgi:hypothetical protein